MELERLCGSGVIRLKERDSPQGTRRSGDSIRIDDGTLASKARFLHRILESQFAVDKTASPLQESPLLFSKRESSELTMYIHMFAFRFKAGVTEEQKKHVLDEIRKLQHEIPAVLECWVGKNISSRGEGYELGGAMKFADQAAFQGYSAHPAHQKLVGWLMPLIEPIEIDFPSTYAS
jgi:stress responsive alpha/beta barrel protein